MRRRAEERPVGSAAAGVTRRCGRLRCRPPRHTQRLAESPCLGRIVGAARGQDAACEAHERLRKLDENVVSRALLGPVQRRAVGGAAYNLPAGVCDWTKPGGGQQQTIGWQTYADGPGGWPLRAAPR